MLSLQTITLHLKTRGMELERTRTGRMDLSLPEMGKRVVWEVGLAKKIKVPIYLGLCLLQLPSLLAYLFSFILLLQLFFSFLLPMTLKPTAENY